MRVSTLASSLTTLVLVTSTPISVQERTTTNIVARHLIEDRQVGHGGSIEYGHVLASTSVYLEDSEGVALLTSQNFTTIIVETPLNNDVATLVAAWGSQPIFSLGSGAGYILGLPEHVYAPFQFPTLDHSALPVKVCTYVYVEPTTALTNVTIDAREPFVVEDFASELQLGQPVTELCVRLGEASSPTTSGGSSPTSTSGNGDGNGSGNDNVGSGGNGNSGAPSASLSITPSSSSPPANPVVPSAGPTYVSTSVAGSSPATHPTSSSPSHSSTVDQSSDSASSSTSSAVSSLSAVPTGTPVSTSSSVAASSASASSSSPSASTSASSAAPIPSSTSTGPNPAYETAVSFANKRFINKGLVGLGAIPGDAVDSFGETISLGSAIHLKSFTREDDGSYSGVMLAQPDRGHNTDKTTDYIARRHQLTFTLNPYYGNTSLEYQSAKSTFDLKYDSTLRYHEADGTPTTGLDAQAVRNDTKPEPIPSSSYNHISTDAEGLVVLADGTSYISDEYGPYIWKYSAEGILLDTIVPPKAVLPYTNGTLDFSSDKTVKGPDTGRVKNQGFEGLTVSTDGQTLYALLQSGTRQDLDSNGEGRYTRMFVYDISGSTPTLLHAYVVKLPVTNGKGKTLAQSEVIYLSEDAFMLLSRDGKGNGDDDSESKHKDFMLFNFDGATDIVDTEYTDGVKPVSPGGVLDSSITAIEPTQFIDIIDETQLARFGLHNGGDFDVSLINSKWESTAIASVEDPAFPNDYFLFSFSDNDFITTNGYTNGEHYVDAYGATLDNQALVWRITIP
ncbi:hypothetical protein I317_07064 [Kwoniella heveanensis CBS 569]|nr:hypothetical protein I317_07064 [Kwoniella heveanensis CBS 569]